MKCRGKKLLNIIYILLLSCLILISQVLILPAKINVTKDEIDKNTFINNVIKINHLFKIEKNIDSIKDTINLDIKFLGVIPLKKMTVNLIPEIRLIPGGQPIGVKLQSVGLIVVGFSDVETETGYKQSPGAISGIELGDIIIEAQNKKLNKVYDLLDIVKSSNGQEIKLKLKRRNSIKIIKVKPLKSKTNEYKIGLWIRDSTSGIGTLTYYDPNNNNFGALGHPINDVDTGMLFPIKDGNIYNANIIAIEQGMRGKPGELKGIFANSQVLGKIEKNSHYGIYGKMLRIYNNKYRNSLPIAYQYEIKEGPATILTTLDGNTVKEYDIVIEKVTQQSKPSSKSMIIRITDPELLSKTGGIVQGMSGSPIIQNGKIVGAITHVFVNRPDMGYGIYIEWMLKEQGYDI